MRSQLLFALALDFEQNDLFASEVARAKALDKMGNKELEARGKEGRGLLRMQPLSAKGQPEMSLALQCQTNKARGEAMKGSKKCAELRSWSSGSSS